MNAVGEGSPVGRGSPPADQSHRRRTLKSRGDPARDRGRGLLECPDRAAQGIHQPPAGLDHDLRGQVFIARTQGERDQTVSKRVGHRIGLTQVACHADG